MSQHLKSLSRPSSRSKIPRPLKRFFSPCIHCGCIDHLSNECLYYPICELCGSYDHDTNGHNRIISLEREINPRNPQHAFKRCEACGSLTHTTTDHYDIEWFRRSEALQAKKAEALKLNMAESSSALRSKTPTKSQIYNAKYIVQTSEIKRGMNYDKTYARVERLKAIRIFSAFATYMNFIVYQMDVKSAFLNGKLKEEVYVKQPSGFESSEFPNHVCKSDKALYGLKQAPRAWYETLSTFLTKHKFVRGFDLKGCSESDYAGCNMDMKSTSGDIELHFIPTQYQLADIFTKPLDELTFKRLIVELVHRRLYIALNVRSMLK
ncbi:retrovirus-related pol polyprotein from transposon TNT 1-94 [Tanacetum coccineum]